MFITELADKRKVSRKLKAKLKELSECEEDKRQVTDSLIGLFPTDPRDFCSHVLWECYHHYLRTKNCLKGSEHSHECN